MSKSGPGAEPQDGAAPPPGWSPDEVEAYDRFMRSGRKSGSLLREDDPGTQPTRSYQLRWRGNDIVLPAAGNSEDDAVGFTTWKDSELNRERFTRAALSGRRGLTPGRHVPVEVALVHRADNTYNRRAISVASPANVPPPGTPRRGRGDRRVAGLDARHLGYLADRFLRSVGVATLPALAELAATRGGEVVCTGMVFDVDDLMLDLPLERVLAAAADDFLASHGRDAWQTPHRHSARHERTEAALRDIGSFPSDHAPPAAITVRTVIDETGHRTLALHDAATLRQVGRVVDAHLLLADERDRERVLPLLERADVPVAGPLRRQGVDMGSQTVPNLTATWAPDGVRIRTSAQGRYGWVAAYNRVTRRLWVEDSRLVDPVTTYAARLGLHVATVGLPESPWDLMQQVPRHLLFDPHARLREPRDPGRAGPRVRSGLLAALRAYDDGRVLDILGPLESMAGQQSDGGPGTEPSPLFWPLERNVRERTSLFADAALSGEKAPCRLCGGAAAAFTTRLCSTGLSYCHDCLLAAVEGARALTDRRRVVRAVVALADLEFDGAPMLEDQLAALHINPDEPAEPEHVDRLLLLRFAVRRGQFPWTRVLEESGLVTEGLRTGRGTLVRARDGHLCLSLREKAVCDFLHQHHIAHDREPLYPTDGELNPNGRRRADWILTDGTLVELWGLPDDPGYAAKMVEKRELARRHALRLVELTEAELPHLPRIFAAWLPAGPADDAPTAWTWSPLLITSPAVAAKKAAAGQKAEGRRPGGGLNEYGVASRTERQDRLAAALRMFEAGHTRQEVANELGVSLDVAKEMLRDARFYADPDTNPARRDLVRAAATAREQGLTRSQFAAARALSESKVKEVWRDAGILAAEPPGGPPPAQSSGS